MHIICAYVYNWRAGSNQPSRTTGTNFLFIYLLASEASLPSRTNGAIFLYICYIYIYIYISNFRVHGLRGYPVFADNL